MSTILSRVKTVEDAEKLSDELDILLSSLFKEKGRGFESALKTEVRAWVSELLIDEISKSELEVEKFLQELRQSLTSFKKLILILAYEPSAAGIERIHSTITKQAGMKVLLDISYMPSLLAGAVIIYEGIYRDLSLKRAFDEEMKKNKEKIMGLLTGGNSIKN
jgi:F0F1-type ATP synthase delta subunit